jgi:hypothetical protein
MPVDLNGNIVSSTSITGSTFSNSIVTDGLIMYIDAADKDSYIGSGTSLTDLSPSANNLTTFNSPTFSSTNGGIFTLNGSNQYIYKSSVNTPPTTTLSMEVMARFADNGSAVGGRYVMSMGRDIGTNGGLALIAYGFSSAESGKLIFELGSGFGRVSSGIVPTINTWYHIIITCDGTYTKFHLNGNLTARSSQSTGAVASSPGISIGSYLSAATPPAASSAWHNGDIGFVRIYNRALNNAEVLSNYYGQKSRFGL